MALTGSFQIGNLGWICPSRFSNTGDPAARPLALKLHRVTPGFAR